MNNKKAAILFAEWLLDNEYHDKTRKCNGKSTSELYDIATSEGVFDGVEELKSVRLAAVEYAENEWKASEDVSQLVEYAKRLMELQKLWLCSGRLTLADNSSLSM